MTTPPRPTIEQVDAAIERIAARRRRIDDPHQEMLSDDPAEVLRYLRKHSGRHIPDGMLADDIEDGIILRHHVWWEGEALEAWLLDTAERLGIPRPRVAEMLGLRTGQGVAERRFRLGEKLHNRRPRRKSHPDVAGRDEQPPATDASQPEPQDVLQQWLAERVTQLERYAKVIIDHKDLDLADDTYEVVLELRDLTRDAARGVPWFLQLTEATVMLTADPAVRSLPPAHTLRRTLARLDDLTSQWAALRRG